MRIYENVIGNIHSAEWQDKLEGMEVDYLHLDQWTAQKSRFLLKGKEGREYPVALTRQVRVTDGDIIEFDEETHHAVVLRVELSPVLVIELGGLYGLPAETMLRCAVELGHALGNQHWPAVVKADKVYVPLTVDKKVMQSVMETHHLEGITYTFQSGQEVIPYLAPHEVRRLFGGAGRESHAHIHSHIHHG